MESALEDLLARVKVFARGPNAVLLRKLVDVLHEQTERREEYDEEPLSPEELAALQEADRAGRRGDRSQFISLEEYERKRGF
jgi:hypothetical protein